MAGAGILGIGMMTAVGVGTLQTATSVRAGVARLAESRIRDRYLDPIVMATLPDDALPPLEASLDTQGDLTAREARMLRLAAPALAEAVGDRDPVAGFPVMLAVPEPLGGEAAAAGERFLARLARQSGIAFDVADSALFPHGRAAGFHALAEALRRIESGTADRVLVGGVDSHLDPAVLAMLDRAARLLTSGDGFAPGEGAAFLLLGGGESKRAAFARLAGVATGSEPGHRESDEPYLGEGLSATFQALFAAPGAPTEPVKSVFAGFNGESFWAKEWGTAYLRCSARFEDGFELLHPVDCFGDPGAALGPILTGLAAIGIKQGHVSEPCLTWCSSDREQRGAALLTGASG
jgi:3-oxoacyl-[acyl-carrier-protein] synthase-1